MILKDFVYRGVSMKILDVVQVVFLILKLSNLVDWSWWFVLSPYILLMISLVIYALITILENKL